MSTSMWNINTFHCKLRDVHLFKVSCFGWVNWNRPPALPAAVPVQWQWPVLAATADWVSECAVLAGPYIYYKWSTTTRNLDMNLIWNPIIGLQKATITRYTCKLKTGRAFRSIGIDFILSADTVTENLSDIQYPIASAVCSQSSRAISLVGLLIQLYYIVSLTVNRINCC